MGGGSPLDSQSVFRVGDPTNGFRSSPKPVAFDVAASDGVTLGGFALAQGSKDYPVIGFGLRAGIVIPIASRLALWPRLGLTHVRATDKRPAWAFSSRTDVVLDARLAWIPDRDWALTVGPTLSFGIQRDGVAPSFDPVTLAFPSAFDRPSALPRIGVSAGITGFLSDAQSASGSEAVDTVEPRFYLSVDRVVPFARYVKDTSNERLPGADADVADGGFTDVTTLVPQAPRLAFDWRVRGPLTLGAAMSVGYVRVSSVSAMVPSSTAPSTFSLAASPRVGLRIPFGRMTTFWPRVGVTYVNVSLWRNDFGTLPAHHLGADLEALLAVRPVRRLAFLLGPSFGVPITGATTAFVTPAPGRPPSVRRVESTLLTIAFTAGLVAEIP